MKSQQLVRSVRSHSKGKRMAPKKPKFVTEVPITSHPQDGGEIVGTAKIEQLPGKAYIAHIDASGMSADILRRGFSLGSFTIVEEPRVQLEKGLDR